MIYFIDMDGVVCDFVRAALELHVGTSYEIEMILNEWPKGEYRIERVLGISTDQFWEPIASCGEDFWALLNELHSGMQLVESLREDNRKFVFLTSPAMCSSSSSGKVRWLQRRFGADFRDYILCPTSKSLLAGPGRVLVDDSDRNCEEWKACGGTSIVWPQPWNSASETEVYP